MHGISLPRPKGWMDKSMIIFNAPDVPPSGIVPNIVLIEDTFGNVAGRSQIERLKAFMDKQIDEINGRLADPIIKSKTLIQVAGQPAAEVCVSWRNGTMRLAQIVTFIARDNDRVIVATGTSADSDFEDEQPKFRSLLQSIRIQKT